MNAELKSKNMSLSWPKQYLLLVFCASLTAVATVRAQEQVCREALKWGDATFVRRTTHRDHRVAYAQVQGYADGAIFDLTFDGEASGMIALNNGLNITFGSGKPAPLDFGEFAMAVEPPFGTSDGRFGKPCAIPAGTEIHYSDNDFLDKFSRQKPLQAKIFGAVARDGAHVRYSMTGTAAASESIYPESVEGEWRYEPTLTNLPQDKDVQGWHVYRGNAFVMTVPTGAPFTLKALLVKLAGETR